VVGWSYLAAINFVETDFGPIAGPSNAGAQGPMRFLPATWAMYGHGDIHSPQAAIMAAARFLRAHGATQAIGPALHAYNPDWRYVDAVLRYARRLRASPGSLTSYYSRRVIYRLADGCGRRPATARNQPCTPSRCTCSRTARIALCSPGAQQQLRPSATSPSRQVPR
jgi:hypothetical protein